MTQKESVQASGSESGSEADTKSQAGGDSGGKEGEDSGSKGKALAVRVNQEMMTHNRVTPAAR